MPRIINLILGLAAITCASPTISAAQGASGLSIVRRIAGPDGGWDYASFDAARRRVYVAHGDEVMAIDADSGQVTPKFAAGAHLHAVVPVPGSDRLVTTNGGDSSAKIIDAATGRLIASVATPPDPDGAVYDPFTGDVMVVSGDQSIVSLVDPRTAALVGSVKVGGGLEFPASDGRGRLYVNVEETNQIAVIDLRKLALVGRYDMPGCQRPTGLAITLDDRLISACANGVVEILSAKTGREIASLKIGAGPDAVMLDEARHLALVPSGRTGDLAVIALAGAGNNTLVGTAPTQRGARTGAVDSRNGWVYLPTARFAASTGDRRPPPAPGTFEVLVLGRSR